MQVDMSLAEILMNAVMNGRVHGMQLKRGFGMKPSDESRCFEDLNKVIQGRLDNALSVARENGYRELNELRRRVRELEGSSP